MIDNNIEIQVCVDGRPVREYAHQGKLFIEGREMTPFTIKLRNHRYERVNAVLLIDSLNVVNGRGNDLTDGYIIQGQSSFEIRGWRTSLEDVASFVFQKKDGSYVKATTGSDAMSGVISLVAYREQFRQVVSKGLEMSRPASYNVGGSQSYSSPIRAVGGYTAPTAVTSDANLAGGEALNLGTGWGDKQQSQVREVAFQNGERVSAMEFWYASRDGLLALGVDVDKAVGVTVLPSVLNNFCRPPS